MRWRKIKSFLPKIDGFTHAANPTYFEGRVFFSPRDSGNRSHVYFAHFDPAKEQFGTPVPAFGPGQLGSFDDSGCSVCQVTHAGILYLGWNLGVTVPFRNTLARWGDGYRDIVKQRDEENLSISYGWEDMGRLYYHSIRRFPMKSTVLIGQPGMDTGRILCRPCVLGDEMWYCYRMPDEPYHIGYARLDDGEWKSRPSGIYPSGSGFDSVACAYPCVFDHEGSRYMLYSGDNYGKTGFGLAVMEND